MMVEKIEFANMSGRFHSMAVRAYRGVLEQREEILKAFIAKHGYQPEEIEQVFQSTPDGFRWWVRKRGEE